MGLNNRQYEAIVRHYEELQAENRRINKQHRDYVYEHIDGFRELEEETSTIAMEQAHKMFDGDDTALTLLHAKLHNLMCDKKQLLLAHGLPDDYLAPFYHCKDCQDTGYINGQKCHCFRQQMVSLLYEQSHIQEMIKSENFDMISYEYYQGEDLLHFQNAVETCHNFVKNFNSDYHNLFFYGTVGTGKSFLSGCVAKELIEKGHAVLYFSAVGLFDLLSRYSFDYKSKEELSSAYADLFSCDLVIIDDLGTELTNNFVTTQLFSCLNERHIRKKATIISTNLSLAELRDRYSDRIFSRITSNYEIIRISGPDIRMYKKRMLNRK
ncbi:MAG: ATP-binding protein [Lachnospiraceae bacterium]|nr:ATP-binding protein [Lachnospiraceae bacterium]